MASKQVVKNSKRTWMWSTLIIIFVLLALVAVYLLARLEGNDIYYDMNGCMQSHTGNIHPNLCVRK